MLRRQGVHSFGIVDGARDDKERMGRIQGVGKLRYVVLRSLGLPVSQSDSQVGDSCQLEV